MVGHFRCIEFVDKGSEGKYIDGFVVGSFLEEFRSHVGRCSAELHGSAIELALIYFNGLLYVWPDRNHTT